MGLHPYNNEHALANVCYIQEEHPFGWLWTVDDTLRFGHHFNPNWNWNTAEKLLDAFQLDRKMRVMKLSKGMRTGLQYIIGLASHAAITIFDEPINGLDAAMRKTLYDTLLENHADHPRLILISSHHIEEFQTLFEGLIVLKNGRVLIHEPMDRVRQRGFWVSGLKDRVESAILGRTVLERKEIGPMLKAMVDLPLANECEGGEQMMGLCVEKAKTQDVLLSITCDKEVMV